MLSFLPPSAERRAESGHLAARLDGIDQEALLDHAVAEFLLGSALGYLVVDLAARVGVLQRRTRPRLFSLRLRGLEPGGPGRQLELEQRSRRATGFIRSFENRKIRMASS